jgi:hypothetical protein
MVLNKTVVIIPSIYPKNAVCDVIEQTGQELGKNHFVLIVQVREGKSLKEIINEHSFQFFKKSRNVYYLYPIDILPFKRFQVIKEINLFLYMLFVQIVLLIKKMNEDIIIWNFFPHIQHINGYFFLKKTVIFDIVDYFTSPHKSIQKMLDERKFKLLKRANHVFAISKVLKDKYQKIYSKKVSIVPQGFDLEKYSKNENNARKSLIFDKYFKKINKQKKILGFVGGINDRLDFELLHEIIMQHPQHIFVFCGPITEDENISGHVYPSRIRRLFKLENVVHIPEQNREDLLNIILNFDICLIPYDISLPFNKYSYPMKIFEYFYAGKPVLSTKIAELTKKHFNGLVYYGNKAEWNNYIKFLINNQWSKEKRKKQRSMALANTWDKKVSQILKQLH